MLSLLLRLASVLALTVGLSGCNLGSTAAPTSSEPPAVSEAAPTDRFGMQVARYRVERGTVRRGETFSNLLDSYGLEYQTILALAEAAKPAFEVQDLRFGRPYRVYINPWLQQPAYVVYSMSETRYVVFDVRRPSRSTVRTREVTRTWERIEGRVQGSLYQSLVQNGGPPLLALRLSEVFAWQIDFFRLQANDTFQLVYERRTIDGEEAQPGAIVAARVRHRGKDYYAFRFQSAASEADYYNREGESLRRQLLKAPLQYSRISSGFTNRRFHPILKEYRPHRGTDYAAPRGTPVRSVGSGVVQFAGYDGPNGNYVKIRHNGTYASGYLHLASIAVAPGEQVSQGERIGTVGSTGRSTGPHLDYRLWKHGTPVNPYTLELPPSQPVPLLYREAFKRTVAALLPRLQSRASPVFASSRTAPGLATAPRHGSPLASSSTRGLR